MGRLRLVALLYNQTGKCVCVCVFVALHKAGGLVSLRAKEREREYSRCESCARESPFRIQEEEVGRGEGERLQLLEQKQGKRKAALASGLPEHSCSSSTLCEAAHALAARQSRDRAAQTCCACAVLSLSLALAFAEPR